MKAHALNYVLLALIPLAIGFVFIIRRMLMKLKKVSEQHSFQFMKQIQDLVDKWLSDKKIGFSPAGVVSSETDIDFSRYGKIKELDRIELRLEKVSANDVSCSVFFSVSKDGLVNKVEEKFRCGWIDIPEYYRGEFIRTGEREMKYVLYERALPKEVGK